MTGEYHQPGKAAELRRQAEEQARNQDAEKPPDLAALPPEEARRMLHELRVHQIELEMQNEELRRAQVELDASRARYFDLYNMAPVGYLTISKKGLILEANLAAAGLWGVTRDTLGRQPLTRFILKEDQDIYYMRRKALFKTGTPQRYELRMKKSDGATFWADLDVVTAQETGSEPVCRITMQDITQRKQAENMLQAANEELEHKVAQRTIELQKKQEECLHSEKLSAIGKLSASVAHEINNPLQGIMSVLKGLKNRAVLDPEDKILLDEAIGECTRIKDLIHSLQEFNRPSSGRISLFNVHDSLDSLILLHKCDFKRKRISVVLSYAEQLPQIEVVSDQIKQVFLNLLTNASDACHQQGGVITITTWQEDEKHVAVSIKDNGVGIHPSVMDSIFQPFYTTKPEVKGTGLGLSISYAIVKNHQGQIRVESQPGEGATFTVLLPIKADDDPSLSKQR